MTSTLHNNTIPSPPSVVDPMLDLPMELQQMLMQAVDQDASDIHLDSGSSNPALRFRVDGSLYIQRRLERKESALRLINQVRVSAGMHIDAIWTPEQGQFRWQWKDKVVDIRVTVAPTAPDNLALHMRLLRPPHKLHGLDELGLSENNLETVRKTLMRPDGLVLISGPTGAGKTTSLYAMLDSGMFDEKLIATVEDPVEYELPEARQLEVDPKHELTMAEGLRTLLRMDPDVLAVGEVRDGASASTTAMAAMAGRLVLATIHARDAASTITAFHRMGVPYYIIGHALRLVINQRMLRKICRHCANSRAPEKHEEELFESYGLKVPQTLYDPNGCSECHQRGYRGLVGIFETLTTNSEFGYWLSEGRTPAAIRERIGEQGCQPLIACALEKAAKGQTSMSEVHTLMDQYD